jgi:hypothetical protein
MDERCGKALVAAMSVIAQQSSVIGELLPTINEIANLLSEDRKPTPEQLRKWKSQHDQVTDNLSGQIKTGQRWSLQNRPTEVAEDSVVLSCRLVWRQVCFCAPAPGTAFEHMAVMEQAIEHGGYRRTVA